MGWSGSFDRASRTKVKTEHENEAMQALKDLREKDLDWDEAKKATAVIGTFIGELRTENERLDKALYKSDTKRYESWARAGSAEKSVQFLEGEKRELELSLEIACNEIEQLKKQNAQPKTWRFSGKLEGFGWYIAFLDDAGCFSVQSDWGDYSHRWPMSGMPEGKNLVQFLADCNDEHYVLAKIASRTWFDADRTRDALLEVLQEMLNSGHVTPVDFEEEKDNIDRIRDQASFDEWYRDSELGLDEAWRFIHMDYEPQARAFMKEVWPRLVEQMKAAT